MSKRESLQSLYELLKITLEGVAIVERIRAGDPVRAQSSGAQSSAGGFASSKMGFVVGFESRTLEFAYVRTKEAAKDVLEIYDQPYHLRLRTARADGREATYTHVPDFLLIEKSAIAFVEVKPSYKLEEKASKDPRRFTKSAEGRWSSPAAEEALAGTGICYRVVSDREINPILVRNLSFLADFRRAA